VKTNSESDFRSVCESHGIAQTHQRQVVYEVMSRMEGHPSPEDIFLRVKERIPSISQATVYKNIHLFVESGIFSEVSPHHGPLRVETNSTPHYHRVCRFCRQVEDLEPGVISQIAYKPKMMGSFLAERVTVEVMGICKECQRTEKSKFAYPDLKSLLIAHSDDIHAALKRAEDAQKKL
jgi:Fur family peroxide stress response transcriptional regulator